MFCRLWRKEIKEERPPFRKAALFGDDLLGDVRRSVLRGDTLGAVGATGNATGAHLHFELLSGSKYLDPIAYAAKTV